MDPLPAPSESPSHNIDTITTDVHNLSITPEPNPWNSSGSLSESAGDHDSDSDSGDDHDDEPAEAQPSSPKHTLPDPSEMDPVTTQGLQTVTVESPIPERPHAVRLGTDILNEFDPLADGEHKAAQNAWEESEGHPPPPPPPHESPQPQTPPRSSIPMTTIAAPQPPPSPFSNAFPAIASFASRTFSSLPGAKARPISLDTAQGVSPSTISSFAGLQRSEGPSNVSSGRSTPSRIGRETDSDKGKAKSGESIPFDFQKFLDQMKTRPAEPVAKYLRSFLANFIKRTFTVNDQVRLVNDFLNFIAERMRECEVWRNASFAEFDNAMEGMEKLVMNRLYDYTFTPQVARATPPRAITCDDLERDRVLSQRTALFGWIEEKHLDVPEGDGSKGFVMFAQQELLKINHYKAPRDKLICMLNCCKVIFGLIRHLHKDEGADSFVPILIFVLLKANPDNMLSNIEYINRFRNPDKLKSEAGYYLSSLIGAVSFIETMDHTSLSNITQEEFEANVESAIQELPASVSGSPMLESKSLPPLPPNTLSSEATMSTPPPRTSSLPPASPHAGEESAQPLALATPSVPTFGEDARRLLQKTGDTISKPLSAIGRIFNEALDNAEDKLSYLPGPFGPLEVGRDQRRQGGGPPDVPQWSRPGNGNVSPAPGAQGGVFQTPANNNEARPPIQMPYKPRVRPSPSPSRQNSYLTDGTPTPPSRSMPMPMPPYTNQALALGGSQPLSGLPPHLQPPTSAPPHMAFGLSPGGTPPQLPSRSSTPNIDFAGMQAEIDWATENATRASRETLAQVFPGIDPEVRDLVLDANSGDLGKSIEALLEMGSGA